MATRIRELQDSVDELQGTVDSIGDLAEEALDPELSREELVGKVKEIQDLASGEESEEEEESEAGE